MDDSLSRLSRRQSWKVNWIHFLFVNTTIEWKSSTKRQVVQSSFESKGLLKNYLCIITQNEDRFVFCKRLRLQTNKSRIQSCNLPSSVKNFNLTRKGDFNILNHITNQFDDEKAIHSKIQNHHFKRIKSSFS